MSRTVPSFAEEGLKRFLHGMDRRLKDVERRGDWRFDDELTGEEILVRTGSGQMLTLSATADSFASGGDYVTFDSVVYQHGFGDAVSPSQVVEWPTDAVGEIQVEHAWDTYEGGGTVEIEVDGTVPAWGLLADGTSGAVGVKRRSVHISAGAVVKIKVTQDSGSAQAADVFAEFVIPGPTASTLVTSLPFLVTDAVAERAATSTGETFVDRTISINWDGTGSLVLANTSAGTGQIVVDDELRLDVTHADGSTATYTYNFSGDPDVVPAGPLDVTSYLETGQNTVRVRCYDVAGGNVEASEIWMVQT